MIGTIIAKKALAGAFDALNRHDLQAFMEPWREDARFIFPGEIYASGTCAGKSAIEGWFKQFFEQFPSIRFDLKAVCVSNIFDLSGNNVGAVHWDVTLTNRDGRVGTNSGVSVVTIKGGKIAQLQDFLFDLGENFRMNFSAP
jgi:ketosteroid isomerase-like protein